MDARLLTIVNQTKNCNTRPAMHPNKVRVFVQTLAMIYLQYQQTLDRYTVNTFYQLVHHFGLVPVQRALQTYQQQSDCRHICPSPTAILHLLANAQEKNQTHEQHSQSEAIIDIRHKRQYRSTNTINIFSANS